MAVKAADDFDAIQKAMLSIRQKLYCTNCGERLGEQHKKSCSRSSIVMDYECSNPSAV